MRRERQPWSSGLPFVALGLACLSCLARVASPSSPSAPPAAETLAVSHPDGHESAVAAAAAPPYGGFAAIDGAVADAIARHELPGAVVTIGRHDQVLFQRAYGERRLEPDRAPMTVDTVFDLASLTKPIATATSIMILAEHGRLKLDDPVSQYVPACASDDKRGITLRHLLLHTSGLPADTPTDDFKRGRSEAIRRLCHAPLRGTPGSRSLYSDLGFVLLEEVVRRVTAEELPDFARASIFAPLGMTDTVFLPDEPRRARAATTEKVDGEWRTGVVHDPRAFALGGVAGHAGLFSTASDLALYARALLGGGEVDGHRILSARTVAEMTAPWDVPDGIRTLGWTVTSAFRGAGMSPRAFGHFGFTGTAMWIDPEKDLFVVVLSNRVHPDGAGDAKPLVAQVGAIAAKNVGPAVGRLDDCPERSDDVRTGLDVLREESFERLRGARIGLVTNDSGRARDGTSSVDLLTSAPGVTLVALFAPEHGLGTDQDGKIRSGVDERTGLPVYSLYGDTLTPAAETLRDIDTLVFDIQDVGTRFLTYASTMRRAMQAARDHELRFLVLDRPDPIDGVDVAGPVLGPSGGSFVNFHALPVRHGMTIGELAYLFDADDHLGVALSVVPMRGWRRASYGDETGLPWINPSPNLHSVAEALLYPALGLLEATNVSVGRGTDAPFERLGAPWMNGAALIAALSSEALPGVTFEPETFTPHSDRFAHQVCHGIHVTVRDRALFEPVKTGLAIARALRAVHPVDWSVEKLGRLVADATVERSVAEGRPLAEIVESYRAQTEAFEERRKKYLLYDDRACGPAGSDR